MKKEKAIEFLLEKRFNEKKAENISNLVEINIFSTDDSDEDSGFGVQLVLENDDGALFEEEYQISSDGIIYSWEGTPVIDERSLNKKIIIN